MNMDYIKQILGINDTSKDTLINYHISRISSEVKVYCNIPTIPQALEFFITEKVINIMRYETNENKGVKSLSIGDTKIDYAVNSTEDLIYSINEADKKILRTYRRTPR